MGWLSVFYALVLLAAKGYSGKKLGSYVHSLGDAVSFNAVRMFLCLLIGLAMVLWEHSGAYLAAGGRLLAIGALGGLSTAVSLVAWLIAIRKNAMVMVDVSAAVSAIIPAVLCLVFFNEPILLPKLAGFALILAATVLLSAYSKTVAGSPGPWGIAALFLYGLGDGLYGFSQQLFRVYQSSGAACPKSVYHVSVYLFALAALLLYSVVRKLPLPRRGVPEAAPAGRTQWTPAALLHIAGMALCLFGANYFQTVAAAEGGISPQVLYPVLKGGSLIAVNFTAMLFFGEKPTARSLLACTLALAGIVLLNAL